MKSVYINQFSLVDTDNFTKECDVIFSDSALWFSKTILPLFETDDEIDNNDGFLLVRFKKKYPFQHLKVVD